jgi:hypothetical protein
LVEDTSSFLGISSILPSHQKLSLAWHTMRLFLLQRAFWMRWIGWLGYWRCASPKWLEFSHSLEWWRYSTCRQQDQSLFLTKFSTSTSTSSRYCTLLTLFLRFTRKDRHVLSIPCSKFS